MDQIQDPYLEEDIELEAPGVQHPHHTRAQKMAYKERGSLVSHAMDEHVFVPGSSRRKADTFNARKTKQRAPKTVMRRARALVDIFIPSIVSVSNLARLLRVRLGMYNIVDRG